MHSRCARVSLLASAIIPPLMVLTAILFFIHYYGRVWKLMGTSFSNWLVLVGLSLVAWIPATVIQIFIHHCINAVAIVGWKNATKLKLLLHEMRRSTTFVIWSGGMFAIVDTFFGWNPFPLRPSNSNTSTTPTPEDFGDLSGNKIVNTLSILLLIVSLLRLWKQYFITTYVKFNKRTEHLSVMAMATLRHEHALHVLSKTLNVRAFTRKDISGLGYADVCCVSKKPRAPRSSLRRSSLRRDGDNGVVPHNDDTVESQATVVTSFLHKDDVDITNDGLDSDTDSDFETDSYGSKSMRAGLIAPDVQVGVSFQLIAIFEYIRNHYISCAKGRIILKSHTDATKLGKLLYILHRPPVAKDKDEGADKLTEVVRASPPVTEQDKDEGVDKLTEEVCASSPVTEQDKVGDADKAKEEAHINVQQLLVRCKHDEDVVNTVKELLDLNDCGYITEANMVDGIFEIYLRRKNLGNTLKDGDSVVKAVGRFLGGFIVVAAFMLALILFSQGEFAQVTVTFSTSIFALSFIFAETAKNLFNSFIFLLVRHPFEVGDRVHINSHSKTDPHFVVKMELLHTTFKVWSGQIVTIPNHVLYQANIINVARAGPMTDELVLMVDYITTPEQLNGLRQDMLLFARAHPEDFREPDCKVTQRELINMSHLKLKVNLAYTNNWQFGQHIRRKDLAITAVKESVAKHKIQFHQSQQRVSVVGDNGSSSSNFSPRSRVAKQSQNESQE